MKIDNRASGILIGGFVGLLGYEIIGTILGMINLPNLFPTLYIFTSIIIATPIYTAIFIPRGDVTA